MGQRFVVENLNEEQLDFVLRCFTDGDNDREVCTKFENAFPDSKLAKSSLHRWRKAAGEEMIERYRIARFQAKALLEQLPEGTDADKYQVVIANIEDRLLTATREVIKQNPTKLLLARQREENFRLKREQLELKREELAFEREKLRGAAIDRVKLGTELMGDLFDYLEADADGLIFIRKHAKAFNEFLKEKYAATEN